MRLCALILSLICLGGCLHGHAPVASAQDSGAALEADALEADAPEAGAPEAEPLVVMSHPSVTEPPEPGLRVQDRRAQDRPAPKTKRRPRPRAPSGVPRPRPSAPSHARERHSARGTVDDGVRRGRARAAS